MFSTDSRPSLKLHNRPSTQKYAITNPTFLHDTYCIRWIVGSVCAKSQGFFLIRQFLLFYSILWLQNTTSGSVAFRLLIFCQICTKQGGLLIVYMIRGIQVKNPPLFQIWDKQGGILRKTSQNFFGLRPIKPKISKSPYVFLRIPPLVSDLG